ncbi:hypothetical protein [Vibrio mediterranei]|uniref:hypothetical protein n=1 Tax=Vibrio mediterranei TaxID=689 RepID=UPI0040684A1E
MLNKNWNCFYGDRSELPGRINQYFNRETEAEYVRYLREIKVVDEDSTRASKDFMSFSVEVDCCNFGRYGLDKTNHDLRHFTQSIGLRFNNLEVVVQDFFFDRLVDKLSPQTIGIELKVSRQHSACNAPFMLSDLRVNFTATPTSRDLMVLSTNAEALGLSIDTKPRLIKSFFAKSGPHFPVTEEGISRLFSAYPTQSADIKSNGQINRPNLRNYFGYKLHLNDLPSFHSSPVSYWHEGTAHFQMDYIGYLLSNNPRVSYVGVFLDDAPTPVLSTLPVCHDVKGNIDFFGILFRTRFTCEILYSQILDALINYTVNDAIEEFESPREMTQAILISIEDAKLNDDAPNTQSWIDGLLNHQNSDVVSFAHHLNKKMPEQCRFSEKGLNELSGNKQDNVVLIKCKREQCTQANLLAMLISVFKAERQNDDRAQFTPVPTLGIVKLDLRFSKDKLNPWDNLHRSARKRYIAPFICVSSNTPQQAIDANCPQIRSISDGHDQLFSYRNHPSVRNWAAGKYSMKIDHLLFIAKPCDPFRDMNFK